MTESDYEFMLTDSRARMLVVSEALYPKFASLIEKAPDLAHVVVSGANGHGHDRFDDLIASATPEDYTAPTTRDDIAFWLYTSGSTGNPKGAVHVHASLKFTNDLYAAPTLGIREDDVCYSVAKLFFAYGLGNAMTFPMSAGATTVLLADRPTPDSVAASVGISGLICPPIAGACSRFSNCRRRRRPPLRRFRSNASAAKSASVKPPQRQPATGARP